MNKQLILTKLQYLDDLFTRRTVYNLSIYDEDATDKEFFKTWHELKQLIEHEEE